MMPIVEFRDDTRLNIRLTHCVCGDVGRGRLAEGHCCLVPADHVPSCRQVDEDVWTELRNFKKCLLQMFMAQARHNVSCTPVAELAQSLPTCHPRDDDGDRIIPCSCVPQMSWRCAAAWYARRPGTIPAALTRPDAGPGQGRDLHGDGDAPRRWAHACAGGLRPCLRQGVRQGTHLLQEGQHPVTGSATM